MDRRQRKTREAILKAFIKLLSEKNFAKITVGEIIERADVGRATFYAHFETKDFLLKELCEELFCHIFDRFEGSTDHHHIFECTAPESVFLHLFEHLKKNDNHILELISGNNNELFLTYFKEGLKRLIESQLALFEYEKKYFLPEDFLINHIAATFVETVRWWVKNQTKESPEEITEYFYKAAGLK